MKNYFWNPDERRLKAAWRLVLLVILFAGAGIPVALASTLELGSLYTQRAFAAGVTGAILLGVAWIQARFVDRRPFADFGLSINGRWVLDLGFGVALGAALMGLIFGVELAAGWIRLQSASARIGFEFHASDLLAQLALFAAVSLAEEVIGRAALLRNLAEGMNPGRSGSTKACVGAWVLAALIFGFLHSANESATVLTSLNIAVAGLLLGLCLLWTGSLALSLGLHFSWNFFQGPIFGFPVSGENVGQTVFDIVQGGPVALTGGAFGPEGGLLSTMATVLGAGAVWLWLRWRDGRVALRTEFSVYSGPRLASANSDSQPPILPNADPA